LFGRSADALLEEFERTLELTQNVHERKLLEEKLMRSKQNDPQAKPIAR
jgi:hypothetical protein